MLLKIVHNSNCKLIANGDGTYDVESSYKDDWTPPQRKTSSASSRYKSEYSNDSVMKKQDIDYVIDLLLGCEEDIVNMKPLGSR